MLTFIIVRVHLIVWKYSFSCHSELDSESKKKNINVVCNYFRSWTKFRM